MDKNTYSVSLAFFLDVSKHSITVKLAYIFRVGNTAHNFTTIFKSLQSHNHVLGLSFFLTV